MRLRGMLAHESRHVLRRRAFSALWPSQHADSHAFSTQAASATRAAAEAGSHMRQERIRLDGSIATAAAASAPPQPLTTPHAAMPTPAPARPPGLPAAAPVAPPMTREQLQALVDVVQASQRVVVLTGAGCSTESNIPDYRCAHATPLTWNANLVAAAPVWI